MPVNIGILSLSYCAGCEVALISTRLFRELLTSGSLRIAYSTLLVDKEELGDVDVLVVTGSVRAREDVVSLREAVKKARLIVTFGSCACFGGVPGLANIARREELIRGVYGVVEPSVTGSRPELTRFVIPVSAITEVNYVVPGCPPPDSLIEALLNSLVNRGEYTLPSTSVCNECPLNTGEKKPQRELRRKLLTLHVIDTSTCFLKQGVVCMGPATRGGCSALCPKRGSPCTGCMGPLPGSRDQAADIIDALGGVFYSVEPSEKILEAVPDPLGLFSMYTLPYSTIPYHKKVGVMHNEGDADKDQASDAN